MKTITRIRREMNRHPELSPEEETAATAELAPIRRSAIYHLVRMHLERLLAGDLCLRTRTATYDVGCAAVWIFGAYNLPRDESTLIVVLSDLGFDLHHRRDGTLLTNLREKPLRAVCRDDTPLEHVNGVWRRCWPAHDGRWPERLARIDAAVAAEQKAD